MASLKIKDGWTLVRDQGITNPVEIDSVNQLIKVKTGVNGLQSTSKFDTIEGTVDASFDGNTDMQYIITAGQSNIRLSNLVAGSSVSIIDTGTGNEVVEGVSVGTTLELIAPYTTDYNALIRIIADGYKMSETNTTIIEGINNIPISDLVESYGQSITNVCVRNVDAVDIGLTGTKIIDVDTVNKTFDVIQETDIRDVFTGIMTSWDSSALNEYKLPINVDDVRGLSISDGWTFTAGSQTNMINEGYVVRNNDGSINTIYYNVKIDNPVEDVEFRIYTDGVETHQGITGASFNELFVVDHTATNLEIIAKEKHPLYRYIIVNEDIISDGAVVSNRFRLNNTSFTTSLDNNVSENLLPLDGSFSHIAGQVIADDINSVSHTFSNGELRLKTGTLELQDAINQIAALSADSFGFDTKLFTKNQDGTISIDQGYYVTINGATLSGSISGLIKMYDDVGDLFATPEFRTIVLSVPADYTGNTVNYIVVRDNANVLTANPDVLIDADNLEVKGTLTAGQSVTKSVLSAVDIPVRVVWGGTDVEIQNHIDTLTDTGVDYAINAIPEVIKLYQDENQVFDDLDAGTKGYFSEIDNIVVNETLRELIVPNTIQSCEISYLYRRWRDWVETDFDRLKYGIALVGQNQEKPASATNNAHLFNPNWFFGYAWTVNVRADRVVATHGLLELQASEIDRTDISQGFTEQRGGVVYVSPLANGSAPVLKIIVGFSTETLSSINNRLTDIQDKTGVSGVLLTDAEKNAIVDILLGLAKGTNTAGDTLADTTIGGQLANHLDEIKNKTDVLPTLSEIEASTLLNNIDMVYIDTDAVANGNGTFGNPFNNVTDGLDYLATNGLQKVMFLSDAELDRELTEIKIYGCGYPVITNAIGLRNYECCEFHSVTLSDFFDKIKAYDCRLEDGCNLWGDYFECSINGSMSCSSSEYVRLINCHDSSNQVNPPHDSIGLTGVEDNFKLTMTDWNGSIIVSNSDNPLSSISIHSNGGRIVLGSTLDEGRIDLYGTYRLIDSRSQSTNSILEEEIRNASSVDVENIDTDLTNIESKVDIIDGVVDTLPTLANIEGSSVLAKREVVYIDTSAITNGDGTFNNPYNSVADGLDDVVNNNFKKIFFMSDAELDRELHDVQMYGCNYPVITQGAGLRDYECCEFYGVTLDGFFDKIKAVDCRLNGTNLWGTYINCGCNGDLSCLSSQYVYLIDCYDLTNQVIPDFDFIGLTGVQDNFNLTITGYDGTIGIGNSDNPLNSISIHSDGGRIVLGSSVDEGEFHLYGIYNLIDSRPQNTNSNLTEEIRVANQGDVNDIRTDISNVPSNTVDNLLEHPYNGFKRDGITPLDAGSLGEHWWQFYPPEIVNQLLRQLIDGQLPPTRFFPIPTDIPDNSVGSALKDVVDVKTKTDNLPVDTNAEITTIKDNQTDIETKVDTANVEILRTKAYARQASNNTQRS